LSLGGVSPVAATRIEFPFQGRKNKTKVKKLQKRDSKLWNPLPAGFFLTQKK
jgi:hypothetical protein